MLTDSNLLYQAIQQRPDDLVLQQVYADSLEEEGLYELAELWRKRFEIKSYNFVEFLDRCYYSCDIGDGAGSGDGYGNGFGFGYCYGNGDGNGDDKGDGVCVGYGDGYGHGEGYGADGYVYGADGYVFSFRIPKKYLIQKSINEPIVVGKKMLIYGGSDIAWIGQVAEITIDGYRLINAGMLIRITSITLSNIAKGTRRQLMRFRKSQSPNGELFIGKSITESYEWIGDLPQTNIG